MTTSSLPPSARRVAEALAACGLDCEIVEVPSTTRSAEEAERMVGCEVGRILKSLVFRGKASGKPVLVLASGSNRVDEEKISAHFGEAIRRADADYVREKTGYAIGGIPPLGHVEEIETYVDEDLFAFDGVWAAAGTPFAIFRVEPAALVRATGATVLAVRKDAARRRGD